MTTEITLFAGSSLATTVSLVALPASPGLSAVEFGVLDSVAVVQSPWTGQTQTQSLPGADMWTAKATLPPLTPHEAAQWKAWLMEMRGMSCAVQLGDPDAQKPKGSVDSKSKPVVDSSVNTNNLAMSQTLVTRGWVANAFRLLLPGDALQIGYRMHYNLNPLNTDANGAATLSIWPSLREQPPDGTKIVLNSPKALFRLASNTRRWSLQLPRITNISFDLTEYR